MSLDAFTAQLPQLETLAERLYTATVSNLEMCSLQGQEGLLRPDRC